jgi:hypothetical protein
VFFVPKKSTTRFVVKNVRSVENWRMLLARRGIVSTGRVLDTITKEKRLAFTIRIDESMRRQLLQWTMDNFKPYSSLVRNLLRDYFAGKRMAKIGEVAK